MRHIPLDGNTNKYQAICLYKMRNVTQTHHLTLKRLADGCDVTFLQAKSLSQSTWITSGDYLSSTVSACVPSVLSVPKCSEWTPSSECFFCPTLESFFFPTTFLNVPLQASAFLSKTERSC